MSPRTPRRLGSLLAALIGLLVAALLTGCGAGGRPGTAVVVGDQRYTPAQVVEATAQINSALAGSGDAATEAQIVNLLVLGPFVLAQAQGRGLWTPGNQYNSFVAKIHNPTPTTVAALRANSAFLALDDEAKEAVLADMKAATIQIDPRYGTLDLATGFLATPNPDWIARTSTAAADK
jgi:hypothetical protein